ncbi:MAG: hypothetical protein WBB97_00955 [Dehalococcoidales bacterium]
MSKKSAVKKPKAQAPKPEEPQPQETPSTEVQPEPESPQPRPKTVEPKLSDIKMILDALTATVLDHTREIAELQEAMARKRKPVASNGKVQILDKQTGQVFPSKNNAYQTLLKSGELKDLVDKGVFGDIPEKNTFGWYALVRELPDRFEEVKPAEEPQQ